MILVISSKNSCAAKRLIQESRVKNQELRVMDMAELVACNFKPKFNFDVLYIRDPYLKASAKYLPKIIKFAQRVSRLGVRVVDANITKGKIGEGKWKDYQVLKKTGARIPETKNFKYQISNIKSSTNTPITHPFILKWIYGMGGKNTFLIHSARQFKKILLLHPISEWMVQEYIPADFEYKVICVGYKALPVILKIKFNKKTGRPDFGHFDIIRIPTTSSFAKASADKPYPFGSHPSLKKEGITAPLFFSPSDKEEYPAKQGEVVKLAESASKLLGRELSKVDILQKGNQFYILEVNRFPGLEGFEKLTKQNICKDFLRYLLEK